MTAPLQRFRAIYDAPAEGDVRLADGPVEHTRPDGTSVRIEESGSDLRLTIECSATDKADALQRTDPLATGLCKFLTLRFARNLARAIRPDPPTVMNLTSASPGALLGSIRVHATGTARLVVPIAGSDLAEALADFDLRMAAPSPAAAADLDTARDMFVVALETTHPVARYLIIYGALAVMAVFKFGAGRQQQIDQLLLAENPALPTTGRGSKSETLFTAARNRFIHPEDRGRDPVRATDEIRALTPQLQDAAARILFKG